MPAPHVRFEWTINLGHIVSVAMFLVSGVLAYTDLKSDVRALAVRAEGKYNEYDKQWQMQAKIDEDQTERLRRSYTLLNEAIRDLKSDVRSDLRDLSSRMVKK